MAGGVHIGSPEFGSADIPKEVIWIILGVIALIAVSEVGIFTFGAYKTAKVAADFGSSVANAASSAWDSVLGRPTLQDNTQALEIAGGAAGIATLGLQGGGAAADAIGQAALALPASQGGV